MLANLTNVMAEFAGIAGSLELFGISKYAARGKAAREQTPRASHSTLETSGDRDAVEIVDADTPSRVPELVPIRYGRMLVSPFTFYRGAASLMAHDLASMPRTGLKAQLCGDAHLSNFGGFASPSRELVFDLNDFDETLPGPFEWDVKRLAASFEIAGRDRGFDDRIRRDAVLTAVRAYRESMNAFAAMNNLGVWYSRLNVSEMLATLRKQKDKKQAKAVKRGVAKARTKDSMKAFAKLTHEVDGEPRIISDPPLIVPIAELAEAAGFDADEVIAGVLELYRGYRRTLQPDRKGAAGKFPLCGSRTKGRGGGQRRHALLDPAATRPRRQRSPLSPGQGDGTVGARAVARS